MKKNWIFFVLLTFVFYGCQTLKNEKATVYGMIYDEENEPVSGVDIYINDEKTTISDISGHFTLEQLLKNCEYKVIASKKGYEDSSVSFFFINTTQVIYIRMYSGVQLLTMAEKAGSKKDFLTAESLLDRAEKAGATYLSVNYLRAVINYLRGNYQDSLAYANLLIEKGYINSYIYLLIADIYEKGLGDVKSAQDFLMKSLELRYDPNVQERLYK